MLRKSLLAGVAMVASVVVLTGAAHAAKGAMKQFSRTGVWSSDAGINDHGYPQCVTSTWGMFENAAAGVMLKFDSEYRSKLLVHLTKSSWSIPKETAVRVELQVDNAPGRVYDAYGNGNSVMFTLDLKDTDSVTGEPAIRLLDNLLKSGNSMRVSFPDGNELPWRASLNGSAAELVQFGKCIDTVSTALNRKNAPTQPFMSGGGSATQPFSNGGKGDSTGPKLLYQ